PPAPGATCGSGRCRSGWPPPPDDAMLAAARSSSDGDENGDERGLEESLRGVRLASRRRDRRLPGDPRPAAGAALWGRDLPRRPPPLHRHLRPAASGALLRLVQVPRRPSGPSLLVPGAWREPG